METGIPDKPVPREISTLLSDERLILREMQRADTDNRIAELKHDLGADGFCLKEFFATEAAFRSVLLLFNLLAEFQRAAGLPGYRAPAVGWWSTCRKVGAA
jgi:hypothetical protein